MNLARAFLAVCALALAAVVLAAIAVGQASRALDADVLANAHRGVASSARRIATAYATQVEPLRDDLAEPLATRTLDTFGRRVIDATIGDNEGVDGGLSITGTGIVADGPAQVKGSRERAAIAKLAATVAREGTSAAADVTLANGDTVAIAAAPLEDRIGIAWARERVPTTGLRGRNAAIALLAAAAVSCAGLIAIAAWIVWRVRRDARRAIETIERIESNDAEMSPPLPAIDGDFGRIVGAVAESSQRRARAEAVARRSERLASLGRLVANAAHEIRNPLNALRLQIAMLERGIGPPVAQAAPKLGAEIERLDAVVGGMLAIGDTATIVRDEVDLAAVARRAIEILEADATARSRTIRLSCDATPSIVRGDEGKLVQLAINVLANAVDAAPEGSTIDVRIGTGPTLCIEDRGAGIEAPALASVFEPFYTNKAGGTGLGLAIAHEIARAHGAAIDVTSEPGATVFRIDFATTARA